ncbi:MAG: nuclease [Epsilonproteobacteria bacterium]|nr:MAG: nuclease [Campylobacterota bacterium]
MPRLDLYFSSWVIALILLSPLSFAGPVYGPYYDVEILKVKDGDTIAVRVEVWPQVIIQTDVRIRGIDTPETRRGVKSGNRIPECEIVLGLEAKAYAGTLLAEASSVTLFNVDPRKTKYAGRISGNLLVDGEDFSKLMIDAGQAVPYEGGSRGVWPCG